MADKEKVLKAPEDVSYLSIAEVWKFIHSVDGKVFAMQFVKKDGSIRNMNGRFEVQKDLKGGEFSGKNIPTLHGIFDMQADGYRSFHVDKVIYLKCGDLVLGKKVE